MALKAAVERDISGRASNAFEILSKKVDKEHEPEIEPE
jgi:hypothetical protein